jgi:hypothetical protein
MWNGDEAVTASVSVRIPYNIPLCKLPWRDYPQVLADLVRKDARPQIIETVSAKEHHLD